MNGRQTRIATRIAELAILAALFIPRGAEAQLSESTIRTMAAEAEEELKANGFEFEFPDLDGNPVTSDDERFKGKVVLVDIWGTWCPPCRREAPSLAKLDERFRERGLEIVGIAFERAALDPGAVQRLELEPGRDLASPDPIWTAEAQSHGEEKAEEALDDW